MTDGSIDVKKTSGYESESDDIDIANLIEKIEIAESVEEECKFNLV